MFKILKIVLGVILVIIATPILLGLILKGLSDDVPPPGQMVDVGGYELHINCIGSNIATGQELPTVIFESGSGVSSPNYHWIQAGVAQTTKICVYDRAGLGWSDESDLPRDAKTVNTALHTLLDKSDIKRPFVFVGHSIAGLYMRDYVETYPEEVSGLVFLDPSHPDQHEVFEMSFDEGAVMIKRAITVPKILFGLGIVNVLQLLEEPAEATNQPYDPEVSKQIKYLSTKTEVLDTAYYEVRDAGMAVAQARENKSLGERPVVVISAGQGTDSGIPSSFTPAERQKKFQNLHRKIADLSSDGKFIIIDDADHMSLVLTKENAEKILPYIREIILKSAKK